MQQKFRLFVQKHENGAYTVTAPGITHVTLADPWEEDTPATTRLAAHGLMLEEVKDDLRDALQKWLAKADPAELPRYSNHHEGQWLEKVEVELRPSDRHGQKRRDRLRLTFSLMLTKEESGQYRVTVPRIMDPPLAFLCYSPDEVKETATREIAAYFRDESLETLLEYEHQRQEFLDEIEVSYQPLKPQRSKKATSEQDERDFWALRGSGMNLSARAKEGKLARAHRREREVAEVLEALAAERSPSILLVGPPGVGKTAIVHEAVRRIREENCPPALRKRQVWYTSPDQLIAGCCFVGSWQNKLKNLVDEVKRRRHLLHMDDLVGLMDAGRWSKGDENMASFLKPFLADGTIVLVGESTPERYRMAESRDPGFLGLFRTLNVEETNEETTLSILGSVSGTLEHQLKVRVEPAATQTAVDLTRRFQPYRAFPGKAVQFLQQAAADAAKARPAGDRPRPGKPGVPAISDCPVVTRQFAVSAFARYTGLPEFLLSDHLTLDPAGVERHFAERLIGQPEAVETVVDLVTVIKAGLNDPHKPLGCFFFVGPTGVGKTEMVKTLAEFLFGSRDRIIRFDMSEYGDPLSVAKLIGSAHGDEEGGLTKRIRLQPFSVVLLDEFEKADPSIFDVMLQVLGEGRLTDAGGRTADFRSAIVIMTSNLGASPREQRRPGLVKRDSVGASGAHYRAQVEAFFRPEFVNRIDGVVTFRPLDEEAMRRIAARELRSLLEREGVRRRRLLVEIDDEVIDLLLETGFSPAYGARPLKREIERVVAVPLARYLVAHRLGESQLIRVRRSEGGVELLSTTLEEHKQKVRTTESPLTPDGDGTAKVDLKELAEGLSRLRLRLHEWGESDTVREIGNEWRKLLAATRRKSFANWGEKAHGTWSRIYHLERLTKRLDQLRDRAEYLEEFANLSRRERYRDYEPELAESYSDLRRDVDYLEIELLCAHLRENSQALLRLRTVGRPGTWLPTLAGIYLRWAKRKGYTLQALVPTVVYEAWLRGEGLSVTAHIPGFEGGPPMKPPWAEVRSSDVEGLMGRVEEIGPSELALAFRGANVLGFLKGESGTHKLLLREEAAAGPPFQTAVVRVDPLEADAAAQAHLNAEWEEIAAAGRPAKPAEPPEIIRIYSPEGDRFVRDLRTGVRTNQVRDVLQGDLDAFILAYLKSEEAARAWE